jgi:phenylalanyl-tRNA synthetase alpha chain
MSTVDRISALRAEGEAAVAAAPSTAELEEVRVRFLGRKAELPNLLRNVGQLAPEERGAVGRGANEARRSLEAAVESRRGELEALELEQQLAADVVDVTLPGSPLPQAGHLHVLTATRREIEDTFIGLGFRVVEGPEIDLTYYNFDALNHDADHPARSAADTFYIADDVVLRTQTSPMQVRAMEKQGPPLYIVVPGRVYRPDNDATHTPQFHQVEGLAVDVDLTLGDLQGTLLSFARTIFGDDREVRLRPHYFPFTEPSVELDVSCFNCRQGFLRDGSRCPLCKGSAWIEILGAGMVDPNLYGFVRESGYDPELHQGFAWGLGIERIAFLKHRVPDLRMFFENDLRLLEQF